MGYTSDPEKCIQRLEQKGLLDLVQKMRTGSLTEPLVVDVGSPSELDKVKHLIYSFFKHAGITGAYRIKWHTSTSFLIEPTVQKSNIIRMVTPTAGEEEPTGYKEPDLKSILDDSVPYEGEKK